MLRTSLRLQTRTVPVLVATLLLVEALGIYRGWRVLLVGLALAWLIAYLWARSLARELRLKRELRFGWLQVGDRLIERLTLTNGGRFPALWAEVNDLSTLPNHRQGRSLSVGQRSSVRWFNDTICSVRGLFSLGPVTIRTGDPLGLYSVELEYPTEVPVLVLPQFVPLPSINLATGGRAEEGKVTQKALERTVSAASVREYLPGDYHRWIHWPTSARRGDLFVRVFDSEPAGDLWIVLDMCEENHHGEGAESTEEHAVVLAASLADRGLLAGCEVGLISTDDELVWLTPRGGEHQRWQILHSLALVSKGSHRLADVLLHLSTVLGRDSSLVVLTADPDPIWVEALASLLHRGTSATVLMLDQRSFGGQADPASVMASLVELDVESHVITRQMLEATVAAFEGPQIRESRPDLDSYINRSREAWQLVL